VGQRGSDGLGPAHIHAVSRRVQRPELIGGQADRYDLHRLSPTTGTPTATTLQLLDVVACFGFVSPLLNLFLTHHPQIV
jgi:hypothetical protein